MRIKQVITAEEIQQAFEIRKIVFIMEQGIAETDEFDEYDKLDEKAKHILVCEGSKPVGTGRVRFAGGFGKIERICVLKDYRANGYGKEIICTLERIAAWQEKKKIKLHGQVQASGFYQKLGYSIASEIFNEDGIDHYLLEKHLTDGS